jgi:26S proteasome regulatory subunit N1
MLRGEAELAEPWAKQLCLGLGLLFLGKQGAVEATVEVRAVSSPHIDDVHCWQKALCS